MLLALVLPPAHADTLVVDGSAYASITDAVEAASDGDTIEIAAGTWYECVDLAGKSLTLVGTSGSGATTLDGAGVCDVLLTIANGEAEVTIQGLTLANAGEQAVRIDAGAIDFDDVALSGVGSSAYAGVGGIQLDGGVLTWTGGGIDEADGTECGGLLVSDGTSATLSALTITHTDEVFCISDGGALALSASSVTGDRYAIQVTGGGTATSDTTTFEDTCVGVFDGATYDSTGDTFTNAACIYGEDDTVCTVDGGHFENDSPINMSHASALTVVDSTFTNISAAYGAMYLNVASASIIDSVFTNNHSASDGGAINGLLADLSISGCTFDGNGADEDGDAIYHRGSLTITDSAFTDSEGTLVYHSPYPSRDATVTVIGSSFSAAENGLVVDSYGDTVSVEVEGSTFSDLDGTALLSYHPTTVANSAFLRNTKGVQASGEVTGSTFIDNGGPTVNYGAAITGSGPVRECLFEGNESAAGGAVYVGSYDGTVEESVFISNRAESGGATYGVKTISGSYFCDNEASVRAGATYLARTVSNSIFAFNASPQGGVLDMHYTTVLTNNTFYGNSGDEGGIGYGTWAEGTLVNNILAHTTDGYALYAPEAASYGYSGTYNAWWENAPDHGGGTYSVVTTGFGNVEADPGFVAVSDDGDCWNDSYALYATSSLRDAGDPTVLDADGSRSDIGATGGAASPWADADGDGWLSAFDCDDDDDEAHPLADEHCDGVDEDCDGEVDEDPIDGATWFTDDDGDGFGDPDQAIFACEVPADATEDASDCDDSRASVNPDAIETCDGRDNDCDGLVDDDDPDVADASTWYADADGDGFGDPAQPTLACDAPSGAVADASDCDDGDPAVWPGADEVVGDGIDQNCDGADAADDGTGGGDTADGDGPSKGCSGCASTTASAPGSAWLLVVLAAGGSARRRRWSPVRRA